jgi:hypothetical protein
MRVRYRFLDEIKENSEPSPMAVAYTGFFDDSELPCYVTKRGPRERGLDNMLEKLEVKDIPGIEPDDRLYKWSDIFEITVPDEPDGWVPYDLIEERERTNSLRRSA